MTIWLADNPPSKKWPLYTRGNVGEVFPEVVLPLTWDLYGREAEEGWREAYRHVGLLADGDLAPDEPMTILGVFGGYCYINASYVRLAGVRAPGGKVEVIDQQFFGASEAPPYVERPGDKNRAASAKVGRTLFQLLRTKDLSELETDKRRSQAWIDQYPTKGSDQDLLDYMVGFRPLFRHLFRRHIFNSMAVTMVSGAVSDLLVKIDRADRLVTVLGGIGNIDSAEPSNAMWALAHIEDAPESDAWTTAFGRFLDEYGSRGPNEWDLASDPWALQPSRALAAIDRMRSADNAHSPQVQQARLSKLRRAEIAETKARLNMIDRRLFDRALAATTLYSQARERSKTTVIRAVHSARLAQRELAARAAARGGPENPVLSCLLDLNEFTAFVADPESFADLLVERGNRHEELSGLVPPFIINGDVPPVHTWEPRATASDPTSSVAVGERFEGIAGCPGVARGRAVVVLEPGDPRGLGPGDVLVAPITDPSWTPLFLAAEAVVVDVGATLSHAVIVSRELGIPCVVSATGATRTIPDGALIEVDGDKGTVTVLELP